MKAVQRINTTALTAIALAGLKRASESLDGNKASDWLCELGSLAEIRGRAQGRGAFKCCGNATTDASPRAPGHCARFPCSVDFSDPQGNPLGIPVNAFLALR